jgi:hypothetical protein
MRRMAFATLCVMVFVATGFAQSQMSSGDIKGTVEDLQGGVLAGTEIRLRNMETGLTKHSVSDASGSWRFFIVPPGSYEVHAEQPGFVAMTRLPIHVTVGSTINVDLRLEVAGNSSEVLVQADSPILEIEKTQQSDTITSERIDNLPINQRNFLDFSMLTSGVTDSAGLNTFSLPQAPTSNLSFLGQNGRSNSVTMDGVDNNDSAVGAERSTLSQDAVQEFQINRSNYSAEFGRASGGLINIVSRSGSNAWHGSIFTYFRNQALDARNSFAFGPNGSPVDPPYSRWQSGFAFGGPIQRDRTFYFLSYEGLWQRESRFVTFMENTTFFQPSASQTALTDALIASSNPSFVTLGNQLRGALTTSTASYPQTVKLLEANSGVFPFKSNTNTTSLKLDHSLSTSNQVFGRLTFTDTDTVGGSFGGLKAPSRAANYKIQDYAIVAGDSAFFGASRVNEFRFQFANRDYDTLPADPIGPEITINGFVGLGRDFYLPSLRNEKRIQLLDNFTIAKGKHVLKFGGDVNIIPIDTTTEVFFGGRFIFGEAIPLASIIDASAGAGTSAAIASAMPAYAANLAAPVSSLQAFNFGLPIVYQQGFGDARAKLKNTLFSGYITDRYRVNSKVTLDFGLRYDVELQPAPVHRDTNNFSPRFGFTYSPMAKLLIRGGYGIYYAPVYQALGFIGRVLNGQQISQVYVPLTGLPSIGISATSAQVWGMARANGILGTRTITPADIAPLGLVPGVTPPVLLATDAGLVNPYSQHFSFGMEREVSGFNVSAMYLGNRGVKLIRSRNVNLRQVGTNVYGPAFGPINPGVLQDNRVESSGSAMYHGLTLNLTKRFSRYYQFQTSYTLSKAIDDTTDFITDLQAANQLNLRDERSLSTFDQRHRLVVSGVFQSPFQPGMRMGQVLSGMTLAPIVTFSSGHPFNLLRGFDANGDTQANTDRPAGAGRNTGIGPGFASFSLRLAKEIHLNNDGMRIEGMVDAFNLFNRVNFSGVNNVVGNMPFTDVRVEGNRTLPPSAPLAYTSASDPRQIQLGLKFKW